MVLDVTKIIFGNKSIEMALTNISSGLRICQVDIRKEIPGPKTGKLKPVATNFYRATRHCNGNLLFCDLCWINLLTIIKMTTNDATLAQDISKIQNINIQKLYFKIFW